MSSHTRNFIKRGYRRLCVRVQDVGSQPGARLGARYAVVVGDTTVVVVVVCFLHAAFAATTAAFALTSAAVISAVIFVILSRAITIALMSLFFIALLRAAFWMANAAFAPAKRPPASVAA